MNRHTLALALVLLYAAGFRLIVLDRPFRYDVEGHGCFYGVMARNYLRFGWAQTHGMPLLTAGQGPEAPIVFYPDHSPLVPLLIAPVYALFGVGEWQTRLPTSLATVAAVYVLYLLLKRFASRRIALIGAALFAATPMTLYFGGFPDVVGMPLVLFILLSIIGYLNFHRQPRLRTILPLVAAFTLAAVSDWPAFIIVPVFLAHFLATRPHRQWPWIFAFCGTACALFATLYIYIALATNSPWNWMVPLFTKHSAIGVTAPFTLSQWFATAMVNNRARHTLPLLVASGLWLITLGPRIRLSQPGATVARILIAWGILHVLIGRLGVYTDEWWWSPLTPGLAVSAALLVDAILRAADHRPFSHVANSVAALLIVLFASWTALTTFQELYPRKLDDPFTFVELGQAVRAAAPNPNDLALLVGGDLMPQWWFYGDRPLRINVWTVEEFKRRLRAESADITYGYWQSWNAAGAGIVFPTTWDHDFGDFRAYLQQHYPLVPLPTTLAAKFEVFDLRHPLAVTP